MQWYLISPNYFFLHPSGDELEVDFEFIFIGFSPSSDQEYCLQINKTQSIC